MPRLYHTIALYGRIAIVLVVSSTVTVFVWTWAGAEQKSAQFHPVDVSCRIVVHLFSASIPCIPCERNRYSSCSRLRSCVQFRSAFLFECTSVWKRVSRVRLYVCCVKNKIEIHHARMVYTTSTNATHIPVRDSHAYTHTQRIQAHPVHTTKNQYCMR